MTDKWAWSNGEMMLGGENWRNRRKWKTWLSATLITTNKKKRPRTWSVIYLKTEGAVYGGKELTFVTVDVVTVNRAVSQHSRIKVNERPPCIHQLCLRTCLMLKPCIHQLCLRTRLMLQPRIHQLWFRTCLMLNMTVTYKLVCTNTAYPVLLGCDVSRMCSLHGVYLP